MKVVVIQSAETLDRLVTLLSAIPGLQIIPHRLTATADQSEFAEFADAGPDVCIFGSRNFTNGQRMLHRLREVYPEGIIIALMSNISHLYRRSWVKSGADLVLDESLDVDLLPEILGIITKISERAPTETALLYVPENSGFTVP